MIFKWLNVEVMAGYVWLTFVNHWSHNIPFPSKIGLFGFGKSMLLWRESQPTFSAFEDVPFIETEIEW